MNRKASMIKIAAVIKAMILPARIGPPIYLISDVMIILT
jgi:hypothetical protein